MSKTPKAAPETTGATQEQPATVYSQQYIDSLIGALGVPEGEDLLEYANKVRQIHQDFQEGKELQGDIDPVGANLTWFHATGQIPDGSLPSVRQTAFYIGMQLEELGEKMEVVLGDFSVLVRNMKMYADRFKSEEYDDAVHEAMRDPARAELMLDGDVDLLWVTLGAGKAMQSDIIGAYVDVADKNWDKKFPDGTFHRAPNTGKVLKREGWEAPQLGQYLHETLRK